MNRTRLLWLAAGALLVIAGALQLSAQRNRPPAPAQEAPLIAGLAGELDAVNTVSVRKGAAVTLRLTDKQWTVAERGDYPADAAKVRKLLLALGDAKIVEEKTSNPENFAVIGVEDPAKPGAASTEITVAARDGSHAIILGKPTGQGNFARRSGDNQSFVIEPAIFAEAEPRAWIEPRLIDLQASAIQRIDVKQAGGASYSIRRVKAGADDFELQGVPPGRKAVDSRALAPSATLLSGLTAEDVAPAGDIDFGKPIEATLTFADGKVLTLDGAQAADKRWIRVTACPDPGLEARTRDRAFLVASYRYDAIFRPLEQLLVPKEAPKGKLKDNAASQKTPPHVRP